MLNKRLKNTTNMGNIKINSEEIWSKLFQYILSAKKHKNI